MTTQRGKLSQCPPPPSHREAWGDGKRLSDSWGVGGTHRRARGTLQAGETTVTLYASVALFACLTLVTTRALRSLEEWRRQAVRRKVH